jgi:hypothetical protein
MQRIRNAVASLTVATLMAVAGCSSDGPDADVAGDGRTGSSDDKRSPGQPVPGGEDEETAKLKAFDPPRKFDRAEVAATPDQYGPHLTSTLVGHRVFTRLVNGVMVTDLATGKPIDILVRPENGVAKISYLFDFVKGTDRVDDLAPFVLERPDGPSVVLAPFHAEIRGQGTTASRQLMELMILDPETGDLRTSLEVELSDEFRSSRTQSTAARVVGAYGQTVVISVRVHSTRSLANGIRETVAVDLSDPDRPKALWRKPGFEPFAVAGGHVVGGTASRYDVLTGLSVKDGRQVWQDPTYRKEALGSGELRAQGAAAAGPDWVVVQRVVPRGLVGSESALVLVDPATGTHRTLFEDAAVVRCHYDQKSVAVCGPRDKSNWGQDELTFALDAGSGGVLWQLPDKAARRVMPEVTAAWHGRVYGRTEAGPVVLDARTGEDVEVDPGVAPVAVNEYGAVAMKEGRIRTGKNVPWKPSLHHAIG